MQLVNHLANSYEKYLGIFLVKFTDAGNHIGKKR